MPKVSEAQLERRRRQILEAALVCFARKGFHRTTMADIAAEAGISDGLAYRYFSGKDEVIRASLGQLRDATEAEPRPGKDEHPEDVVVFADLLIDVGIRRYEEDPAIFTLMSARFQSWAEACHDPALRDQVLERWRQRIAVAEGMFLRAREQGLLADDVDVRAAARVMLAIGDGLSLQAVLDPDTDMRACKDVMLAILSGRFAPGSETTGDQERR